MGLEEKNTVIVGLQWGDEGKGKSDPVIWPISSVMSFDSKVEITQDTHWLSMDKKHCHLVPGILRKIQSALWKGVVVDMGVLSKNSDFNT